MADQPEAIVVIARIKARRGGEEGEKLRNALTALLAPTRAEQGCIVYELHDLTGEDGEPSADTFMFYEVWRSKADLDAHLEMPYMKAFFAAAPQLLGEPVDLTIWRRIGK